MIKTINLKDYETFNIVKKSSKYIKVKAKTGPSKITKIPLYFNEELAFLIGIILGDGHLKKDKKRISLEMSNKKTVYLTKKITENLFEIRLNIIPRHDKRENRKPRYYFNIDSSMIYLLLNKLGVPIGKKSSIIEVPLKIIQGPNPIKKAFLLGVFCAEGGKRRWKYYGLSSSSNKFRDGIVALLKELNINVKKDQWLYKKYKKNYYGLYFERESLKNMQGCRSGQTGWILDVLQKTLEGQA